MRPGNRERIAGIHASVFGPANALLFLAMLVAAAAMGCTRTSDRASPLATSPALIGDDVRKQSVLESVELAGATKSGVVVVARTLDDLLEFYRLVGLSSSGRDDDSGKRLETLIDAHRLGTVQKGTRALVLTRTVDPSTHLGAPEGVPWSRIVQVRILNGEGQGREGWTDSTFIVQR